MSNCVSTKTKATVIGLSHVDYFGISVSLVQGYHLAFLNQFTRIIIILTILPFCPLLNVKENSIF
jgi:hypothetical protein